jgi:hypothetical protein
MVAIEPPWWDAGEHLSAPEVGLSRKKREGPYFLPNLVMVELLLPRSRYGGDEEPVKRKCLKRLL